MLVITRKPSNVVDDTLKEKLEEAKKEVKNLKYQIKELEGYIESRSNDEKFFSIRSEKETKDLKKTIKHLQREYEIEKKRADRLSEQQKDFYQSLKESSKESYNERESYWQNELVKVNTVNQELREKVKDLSREKFELRRGGKSENSNLRKSVRSIKKKEQRNELLVNELHKQLLEATKFVENATHIQRELKLENKGLKKKVTLQERKIREYKALLDHTVGNDMTGFDYTNLEIRMVVGEDLKTMKRSRKKISTKKKAEEPMTQKMMEKTEEEAKDMEIEDGNKDPKIVEDGKKPPRKKIIFARKSEKKKSSFVRRLSPERPKMVENSETLLVKEEEKNEEEIEPINEQKVMSDEVQQFEDIPDERDNEIPEESKKDENREEGGEKQEIIEAVPEIMEEEIPEEKEEIKEEEITKEEITKEEMIPIQPQMMKVSVTSPKKRVKGVKKRKNPKNTPKSKKKRPQSAKRKGKGVNSPKRNKRQNVTKRSGKKKRGGDSTRKKRIKRNPKMLLSVSDEVSKILDDDIYVEEQRRVEKLVKMRRKEEIEIEDELKKRQIDELKHPRINKEQVSDLMSGERERIENILKEIDEEEEKEEKSQGEQRKKIKKIPRDFRSSVPKKKLKKGKKKKKKKKKKVYYAISGNPAEANGGDGVTAMMKMMKRLKNQPFSSKIKRKKGDEYENVPAEETEGEDSQNLIDSDFQVEDMGEVEDENILDDPIESDDVIPLSKFKVEDNFLQLSPEKSDEDENQGNSYERPLELSEEYSDESSGEDY